jgi:hypothetical protein
MGFDKMNEFNDICRWAHGLSRRVVLFLPVVLAAGRARAAEPRSVGTISRLVGSPMILRPGGRRIPAARGMMLHEGDRVATGSGGRLEITADDGTVIVVGEETTVMLTRFVAPSDSGTGQGLLDLLEGILRLQLPRSWNRFEVITATAVASVRSTDWIVDAGKPGNTAVFVVQGRVEVENSARTSAVLLDPGFGTDVPAGGLSTMPKRWGQARVDAVMARTRIP